MAGRPANERKMATSKVYELARMVEYGEDAVVSRTLVDNKAGTITLFSFDAGQGLSEHTAPFDALVQMLDGEGEFTVGGKRHRVPAGNILLMPANVPHAVKAKKRFTMLLVMLRARGKANSEL